MQLYGGIEHNTICACVKLHVLGARGWWDPSSPDLRIFSHDWNFKNVSNVPVTRHLGLDLLPSGISYVFMNSAIALLPHSHSMPMSQLCISVNFELDHDRSRSSFVTYMNDLIVILTEASLQSNTFSDNRQRSQTSSFHRFPSIFTQSSLFTFYIKTNDKFI